MKKYDVVLTDARGVSTADREVAEKIFRESLEKMFGGPEEVAWVFLAATAICESIDGGIVTVSGPDRRIIAQWFAAMRGAEALAFHGWHNPGRAHFEVSV